MKSTHERQIRKNANHVVVNSKPGIKLNNNFQYNSKSFRGINNNRLKNESELDHPKPLITDYDEDLDDLKSQFNIKQEKETNDNKNIELKNNKNIETQEKIKSPSKGQELIHDKEKYKKLKSENLDIKNNDNKNENNLNLNREIKSENLIQANNVKKIIPLYQRNSIEKINNKFDNYSVKSFNTRNNNKNMIDSIYKNIHEENKSNDISTKTKTNNNNITFIKNNNVIKNKNTKNENIQKLRIYPSSITFNTTQINEKETIKKLVYQECEKNNSQEKKVNNTFHNTVHNIENKNQKPKITLNDNNNNQIVLRKFNSNITNNPKYLINDKNNQPTDISNSISSNKENKIPNVKMKKKIENSLKEMKVQNIEKKWNINSNPFDQYNNTKTTVVVFSKLRKINQIPKANKTSKVVIKQHKMTNQKSLNNMINKAKNSFSGTFSFREDKSGNNQNRKILINKSQKRLKLFGKNNHNINYRNFVRLSVTENSKNNVEDSKDGSSFLINKINNNSRSNKQNIISIYNYDDNNDYDYYYGYTYDNNLLAIDYNTPYIDNYNY